MSDDKDEKDESTTSSITTHTRRKNIIPGIDDAHLALGAVGVVGAITLYNVLKDPITNMLQNMNLARQQQAPPPPPPVEPIPAQAAPVQVQTEYTEEEQTGIRQPNGSAQVMPDNTELQETDHKNYQMRRRPRNGDSSGSESPFGKAIARG